MTESIYYKGSVYDYKYTPRGKDYWVFYLTDYAGKDTLIGQIWKCDWGYDVVSNVDERTKHIYPVSGFKTRWKAAEFLLKDSRFYEDYRE